MGNMFKSTSKTKFSEYKCSDCFDTKFQGDHPDIPCPSCQEIKPMPPYQCSECNDTGYQRFPEGVEHPNVPCSSCKGTTVEEKKPLIVFVATLPDKHGRETTGLVEISKLENIVLLHPCYDFNSEQGKKTLALIGPIPKYDNTWEHVMRKDFLCIEKCNLVVFDLDSQIDNYFLAVAACYYKPIIAMSSVLASVPICFSGSVSCIVKPFQIANVIKNKFLTILPTS